MPEQTLRIFVSSPSDVAAERMRVQLVADRLNGELEGRVRLDVLRWEDAFYTAAHSFQEAIDRALDNMSANRHGAVHRLEASRTQAQPRHLASR